MTRIEDGAFLADDTMVASYELRGGWMRLGEVRICMSKDLRFRDCAELDRRACRRDKLTMPPVRGG